MASIGIDLGTTYTRVAVFEHGTVNVIPCDADMRSSPSCVTFDGEQRFIGEAAKNQATKNPQNTIFNAKRLIGRKYHDPTVQIDINNSPFKIINGDGKPKVKVPYHGDEREFLMEEVTSMILSNIKESIERHLGGAINDVVITVPSYYDDAQRLATKNAAAIAGLNAVRLLNETSAAAFAYKFERQSAEYDGDIVVFHCGGGSVDVSVVNIDGGIIEVLATSGDTHLGGEDFDNRILDFLVQEFQKKQKVDILSNKRALRKLRIACEKAKRALSVSNRASVEVDALHGDIDFYTSLTRETFEGLNEDLFQKLLEHVDKAMRDSRRAKSDIRDIILVGGSTRIPKIRQMLSDYFSGKSFCSLMDAEESVALGAAIQAGILNGDKSPSISNLLLIDVLSRSLFIEGVGVPVIKMDSSIPCKNTEMVTTFADNQVIFSFRVFERDGFIRDNLLGTFTLINIPPSPKGEPEIELIFDVDLNGILTLTAKDKKTGNHSHNNNSSNNNNNNNNNYNNNNSNNNAIAITTTIDKDRLTQQDIDRMSWEAKWMKTEDGRHRYRLEKRNNLEAHIYQMQDKIESEYLAIEQRNMLLKQCDDLLNWLEENAGVDVRQLEVKKYELDEMCRSFLKSF